jgi:predicted Zn-dependent protease
MSEIKSEIKSANNSANNRAIMLNRSSHQLITKRHRWFYPALSVLVAGGISLTAQPSLALPWGELIFRGIQVIQLSTLSDKQEVNLGKEINQQLISTEVKIHSNRALNAYIDNIGQKLAAVGDRPNIPYTFQVVDSNDINAFATMGGFVYINLGLIKAADNEAELASVIAHEIGHITGRHAVKQLREMSIAQGVATAAGLNKNKAVQIGVEMALRRPRSRGAELDADRRGLKMLAGAGYDLQGAITFMEKLLQKGGSVPSIISTHPATSKRIEEMQKIVYVNPVNQGNGLDSVAYEQNIQQMLSRASY